MNLDSKFSNAILPSFSYIIAWATLYSAFVDDNDIISCRLLQQEIAPELS